MTVSSTLCSITTLAKVLGVSPRRVQQLALEGHVVKGGGRGEYELVGSIRHYIAYCESRIQSKEGGVNESSLSAARKRLIEVQTEKTVCELAILRKEWVAEADVSEMVGEITQRYIRGLESLPGRLAVELVNQTDAAVVRQKILHECRQIRRELSKALYERGAFYEKHTSIPVPSGGRDEDCLDTDTV